MDIDEIREIAESEWDAMPEIVKMIGDKESFILGFQWGIEKYKNLILDESVQQ